MSDIVFNRFNDHTAEIQIQTGQVTGHAVRVYRCKSGCAKINWPMVQDVDARTARLYAEALMAASRMAEELCPPCPTCGGCMEIHRTELIGTETASSGHVHRCTTCGTVVDPH